MNGLSEETQVMSYLRRADDDVVIIVVNMDVFNQAGPLEIKLTDDFGGKYELTDELTGERYDREGDRLTVVLGPGQSHVFGVEWQDQ